MNSSTSSPRLRPFKPMRFGAYTLLAPLSAGGMGEVFLARPTAVGGIEHLCIIKKILPQFAKDPEFLERFAAEARTLLKVTHENVAQVLDMGLHDEAPYIAIEFVDGKDLRRVAARMRDRNLPVPLSFTLGVACRVLDALAYAHRKTGDDGKALNLVHRDVSPQNVLISYDGAVKVIDFGLAKSKLSTARTSPGILLGKFRYMAPEQARHMTVDRRSDLYSLGLCLYELVTGRHPFEGIPDAQLVAAVANPKHVSVLQLEPLCPQPLAAAIAKALAIDPIDRFQSAEEFHTALRAILDTIEPNSGPEQLSRVMQKAFEPEFTSERKNIAWLATLDVEPDSVKEEVGTDNNEVPFIPATADDATNPGSRSGTEPQLPPARSSSPALPSVMVDGQPAGEVDHEERTSPRGPDAEALRSRPRSVPPKPATDRAANVRTVKATVPAVAKPAELKNEGAAMANQGDDDDGEQPTQSGPSPLRAPEDFDDALTNIKASPRKKQQGGSGAGVWVALAVVLLACVAAWFAWRSWSQTHAVSGENEAPPADAPLKIALPPTPPRPKAPEPVLPPPTVPTPSPDDELTALKADKTRKPATAPVKAPASAGARAFAAMSADYKKLEGVNANAVSRFKIQYVALSYRAEKNPDDPDFASDVSRLHEALKVEMAKPGNH